MLDQSWALLTGTERSVFSDLTVFNGSFQREAASEIAGASLSTLLALVDKSFLKHDGAGRFAIHELVKQYGNEKLRRSARGETPARLRHCHYYATFLYERMQATDSEEAGRGIESEFDEIQAAWRFAVASEQTEEIRLLAVGFRAYYSTHSWYRAGADSIELYQRALKAFGSEQTDQRTTLACLHESLGHLYKLSGIPDKTLDSYQQALLFTSPTDLIEQSHLCHEIGEAYVNLHKHDLALDNYERAEKILKQIAERDKTWWHSWTTIQLKRMALYYWMNRVEDMTTLDRQVETLIEEHALSGLRIWHLHSKAITIMRSTRFFKCDEAIPLFRQQLALNIEEGNLGSLTYCYANLGMSNLWSDRLDEAEPHFQTARTMAERNGDLPALVRVLTYLAVMYRRRGDVEHVRELADESLALSKEAQMPQYIGTAYAAYAWLASREKDSAETLRQGQLALQAWAGIGEAVMPVQWLAHFPLIGVALERSDIGMAVTYARQILRPSQSRLPDELTQWLESAVADWERNLSDHADESLQNALQLAESLGYL